MKRFKASAAGALPFIAVASLGLFRCGTGDACGGGDGCVTATSELRGVGLAQGSIAIMTQAFAMKEDVDLAVYPGQNCAVLPRDGRCPTPDEVMADMPDYLATQVENCFQHKFPKAYTNLPAIHGHAKYDYRAYECHSKASQGEAYQRYYEDPAWYRAHPLSEEPTIGRRGCGFTDNACLDACVQEGIDHLDRGYAYETGLCFPVYEVFAPWWKPRYLCDCEGEACQYMASFDAIERVHPDANDWYSVGADFLPLDPMAEPGEFSQCFGFAAPTFDPETEEMGVPQLVFVANVHGEDHRLRFHEGRDVMRFVFQKVQNSANALLGKGGIQFERHEFAGTLRRNWVQNAQGDVAFQDGEEGGIFWGDPRKLGDARFGMKYTRAIPVKKYPKHGKWIVASDFVDAWPFANNEASSFLDGFVMNGQFIDIPNQKIQIPKPM